MCFSNVYDIFPSQNSKLVYSLESLSLKPMQGNEVVYSTALAPLTLNPERQRMIAFRSMQSSLPEHDIVHVLHHTTLLVMNK